MKEANNDRGKAFSAVVFTVHAPIVRRAKILSLSQQKSLLLFFIFLFKKKKKMAAAKRGTKWNPARLSR